MAEPRVSRGAPAAMNEEEDVSTSRSSGSVPITGAGDIFRSRGGTAAAIPKGRTSRGSPDLVVSGQQSRYDAVPPANAQEVAFQTYLEIVNGQKVNPFAANAIMNSYTWREAAALPELAFMLKGNGGEDLIEGFAEAYWTQTMDAIQSGEYADEATIARRGQLESHQMTAEFFSWKNGSKLSEEQRDTFLWILASMPDAMQNAIDKGVSMHDYGSFFGSGALEKINNVWQLLTKAPESVRGVINDPRGQLISLSEMWLRDRPLETPEDERDFFNFVMSKANASISEFEQTKGGFFAVAQQTVGWIPDAYLDGFNDALVKASDPDHYGARQFLSIGQNTAANLGFMPSDPQFNLVSSSVDAFGQIWLDPQNLIFGAGTALKTAGKIPRAAGLSKKAAMLQALHPFSGSKLGIAQLPMLDRSLTGRLFYAAFSGSVDEVVDSPAANRLWKWVAKTSSQSDIINRFPELRDQASGLVEALAEADNVDEIRELVRAGMHGAAALETSAPLAFRRAQVAQQNAVNTYLDMRRARTRDPNFNLADLMPADVLHSGERVYTVAKNADVSEKVVQAVRRHEDALRGAREVARFTSKTGEEVIIRSDNNRTFAAFVGDRWAGGLDLGTNRPATRIVDGEEVIIRSDPEWGVAAEFRDQGIGSALVRAGGPEAEHLIDKSASITGSAAAARGLTPPVLVRSTLAQDGTKKAVLALTGRTVKEADISKAKWRTNITKWLIDQGDTELAARIEMGHRASSFTLDEQAKLVRWMDAAGVDVLTIGDEAIANPRGTLELVTGVDGKIDKATNLSNSLGDAFYAMNRESARLDKWRAGADTNLWVVKNLPSGHRTTRGIKNFGRMANEMAPKRWREGLRRTGFQMAHKLPSNISLTQGGGGGLELRNWIKALGGTDELASKWMDEFLAAPASLRYGIVQDAIKDVGQQIDNPMIRYGLFQYVDKQGHYTYSFNRAGNEIGGALDGSVTPVTRAHMSDTFSMPDAKQLLRSIKRYNQKSKIRFHAGIIEGTKSRRAGIVRDLSRRMKAQGLGDVLRNMSDEDLARLAYSDVIADAAGGTRGAGAGVMNKAITIAGKPLRGLHNVFVIAQLAFRPIAWASRVLIEETVRADLMGMPSMWNNPWDFIGYWMDARAIRKLPEDVAAQAKVGARMVDDMFDVRTGKMIPEEVKKVFPDIDLAEDWTRADLSSLVSRELVGTQIADAGSIGMRSNITKRAFLRRRRINASKARVKKYKSIDETFSWKHDGTDIANRSFYQDYMSEAGSATTIPLEWHPTAMTPKGRQAYGRAYGRQVDQMLNDPLVGGIGVRRKMDRLQNRDPDVANGASRLVEMPSFRDVEHLVDRKLAGDGQNPAALTRIEKAQIYLDDVVDELVETLFSPLLGDVPESAAETLSLLKSKKAANITIGNQTITLNRSSYETFVGQTSKLAEAAFQEGVPLPTKIAGFFDPRFGQRESVNGFRRVTDWTMQKFGEGATQALNRQPAYLATREKYFRYYTELGWEEDVARQAAAEKAAELVNYVFFDNQNIPSMLHDMNKIMPFFSAMFEVGQTWAYKIPATNMWGLGAAHLLRRVSRTLSGLTKSGLVTYDPESGSMVLNVSEDMRNAQPGAALAGRAVYEMMRAPITTIEHMGGIASLLQGEGFDDKWDFSAWTKDGFAVNIGNPLMPFNSHGLGAINQFSVGFTPGLQVAASWLARVGFAMDDEIVEPPENTTLSEWMLQNPDEDAARVIFQNRDAFIATNNKEAFNRVMSEKFDPGELVMPDVISLPKSSWWETMIDTTIFPFGKLQAGWGSGVEAIASVSPAAMNYVWRSMFNRFGEGSDSEIMGMIFGQMSNYQVAAEKISQAQMLEASEGLLTKQLDLATKIAAYAEKYSLEITADPDGSQYVLDATGDRALELQAMLDEADALSLEIVRRIEGNTGGALFARGLLGQLGPATPRMTTEEQRAAAIFWAGKDIAAERAAAVGAPKLAETLAAKQIRTVEDMALLSNTVQKWLEDPSGDYAKAWLRENNPGMLAQLSGKSFYGEIGYYPETKGFDEWAQEIESGEREGVPIDVWLQRYNRASIAADKNVEIINRYGNDVGQAAATILSNWQEYKEITEPFDMRYAGLDFLDDYVYDSALKRHNQRGGIDSLSQYGLLLEKHNNTQQEIDNLVDLLEYTDLDAGEIRSVSGALSSTLAEAGNVYYDLRAMAEDSATWQNPLEQAIGEYFDTFSNEYYAARNEIFQNDILLARSAADRTEAYNRLRAFDNEVWDQVYTMEINGQEYEVPAPMLRSWNAKTDEERAARMLSNIAKRGEWLNNFEIAVLVDQEPSVAQYLPTVESMRLYDRATAAKLQLDRDAKAYPEEITPHQKDKMKDAIEEQLTQDLINMGRSGELLWQEAVPLQRIDMAAMLPETLSGIMPKLNQTIADLRAQDKSNTTNVGRVAFLKLVDWLEGRYFAINPQAEHDFMGLAGTMYGEALPDGAYARLLQGRYPMSVRLE